MKRLAKEFAETTSSTFNTKAYTDALTKMNELGIDLRAMDHETRAWALNDLVTLTSSLVTIQKAVEAALKELA